MMIYDDFNDFQWFVAKKWIQLVQLALGDHPWSARTAPPVMAPLGIPCGKNT